ncbi:hypothetical protein FOC27_09485 [Burkholderia multivorans]|nr:hypothetical protein [Burkholderia multivorans]QGR60438.1 hypothetical protein FOC27_09485 [Burkholderia multivorans]
MRTKTLSAALAVVAIALSIYIFATTICGASNHFSVIPVQDQWDGFIGFAEQISRGDWKAFWYAHVNHRLVIPRLIFLADIEWFGGWNIFTAVISFIAAVALVAVIAARIELPRAQWWVAFAATAGLVFSWCNGETYAYAFNVQNTSVMLFAMWAVSEFSRAGNRFVRTTAALVLAVLAELCAANGLIVFPVLLIQALILRRPLREVLAVVLVGAVAIGAYLYDYAMPIYPVSPDVAAIRFPAVKYGLLLAGAPFNHVFHNYNACALIGAMFLLVGIAASGLTVLRFQLTNYRAFLIGGAAFCVASMLAAAHGRWPLGLEGAFAGRYAILPLLYYLFSILLIVDLLKGRPLYRTAVYALLILVAIFAPVQRAAQGKPNMMNARLAVLGTKIGLDQPYFDSKVYPAQLHGYYITFAEFANTEQIGPWATGWLHDAGIVKYDPALRDDSLCTGTFDRAVKAEQGYQAFGWVLAKKYARDATLIVMTDRADQTIGYGVSGAVRKDVAKVIPGAPLDAGWSGFASNDRFGGAYAYLGGKFCQLRTNENLGVRP